ncbi:MAG: AAA family ATPase, partial [Acidimicrobiaceae bacterium]|nr:AAA family ATPase [Acidimicrobiaceae bacterium]
MKAGEIQHRLASTNRWWSDRHGWAAGDSDLREAARAPFSYTTGVLDDLTPGGLYVVRGPRRVGKSVAMKRAVQRLIDGGVDPRLIVHMSVEGWGEADLERLVGAASQITPTGAPRYWFLDEISGVAGRWPDRIKWLRDNDPRFRSDTVVLTGSSSSNLKESLGALAGRRGG